LFTVTVESMVSNRTGEPLVSFYWPKDRDAFQASPAEARAFAARILECVEAAIGDAFLMRFGVEKLGIEEGAAAAVVSEFRKWRQAEGVDGPGWRTEEVEGDP